MVSSEDGDAGISHKIEQMTISRDDHGRIDCDSTGQHCIVVCI